MKINRSTISNIIFLVLIALLLFHTPTKSFILRLIAFSPSLEEVENRAVLSDYNMALKGLNTKDINLSELKGKVVLVNYWATWCPPCIAEMPMLQNLYNTYKDDVAFLFITTDKKETVNQFFSDNNYNLPTYNMMSNPPVELNTTNSIPVTYVIDKRGNIVIEKVGAADWDSKKSKKIFNQLLAE
ncbi:MAG: thiol-disulfide oxidoreductase [Flavobacteriales bacterium]|nr:MAG: thiol-disulfide oxidoreductase [Flavobacteriales bacterium]